MKNPTPNQHYRLSLEEAKKDYTDGILTATGLIYYAIGIYRAPGQKLRVSDIDEFCEYLGINRATFYRAISKLKLKNRIDWEAVGGVDVWIVKPSNVTQLHAGQGVSQDCESQSQACDNESQACDNESQSCKTQLQGCETGSQGCDDEPPEPSQDGGSGNSSDYYSNSFQLFFNSLSNSERESFLSFSKKQAERLPKPVVLIESWIAANYRELWNLYQEFLGSKKAASIDRSSAPAAKPKMEIEHLKRLYGANWRQAAAHFGYVEELSDESDNSVIASIERAIADGRLHSKQTQIERGFVILPSGDAMLLSDWLEE